jgi:hypothetical protein
MWQFAGIAATILTIASLSKSAAGFADTVFGHALKRFQSHATAP